MTVTGGHFYTYTYWQEVQTGTQQVQTGTTTQTVWQTVQNGTTTGYCTIWSSVDCSSGTGSGDNCPSGATLTATTTNRYGNTCGYGSVETDYHYTYTVPNYITEQVTETVPVYTTEPVYTNEQFTGTAWSPATITYS